MHVIATAGHVDHGKSTLVRAITGQDPDRLTEERRRGLTIELGYCWTTLPGAGEVAFVDVPGHERFLSTMLAGVGPVPAVLFVAAADDPWMPQADEHLAALDAFGVRHGVVAITRSDLADPRPVAELARERMRHTSLHSLPVVAVSATTGAGLAELQRHLVAMVAELDAPSPTDPVRLWVDRRFSLPGAGTVVTATLPAGTIATGDRLCWQDSTVVVRGIQTLGRPSDAVHGVARVALRLGSRVPPGIGRGSALTDADNWRLTDTLDVRSAAAADQAVAPRPVLHIGAAAVAVHPRRLGADLWRLRLMTPLPLHVGDRIVLRDPGSRALWGAIVLDPAPPQLSRRGDARRRAMLLAETTRVPDLADELRRRRVARVDELRRYGVPVVTGAGAEAAVRGLDWLLDGREVPALQQRLTALVEERRRTHPLDAGVPLAVAAAAVDLPTPELVAAILPPRLTVAGGRVVDPANTLPPAVLAGVAELERWLAEDPFAAPEADRLRELGLDTKALAAAAKAGRLLRVSDTIVLLPGADHRAAGALRALPQPFTASAARTTLGTTRRVILPLLELMDDRGLTRRLPDDRRVVVAPGPDRA